MVNTLEPANRKSISSLQEEIDYLQEENHAKTQIIKHLTDMKVVRSNSDIGWLQVFAVVNQPIPILIASKVIIKNLRLTQKLIQNQTKTWTKSETNKTKISLKSQILIISTKRTKNESTVQRITSRKKRKRTRKIKNIWQENQKH